MKILLTNHHPSDGGGHTTYLIELARRLANEHTIFIAAPKSSKLNMLARELVKVQVMDVDFPGTLKEPFRLFSAVFRLARLIDTEKIDVIHVNGSPDHRIIVYVSWLLGRRLPVVLTKHNTFPSSSFGNRLRAKYTSAVIAVCKSVAVTLKSSAYQDVPIFTIPNGVDVNYYAPTIGNDVEEYQRTSQIVFVSVAGTPLYKGWQYMVAAIASLPEGIRAATKIVIAGEMPTDEIREKYVEQLGMTQYVFFTGVVADVRQVIAEADVGFVLSEGVETISFACREMMAMGKPVLVSDYSGLPENIEDGVDGWITKTGDVESIRAKVMWIIDNLEKIQGMGNCARLKAVREFSIEDFVKKTLGVYANVASSFGK